MNESSRKMMCFIRFFFLPIWFFIVFTPIDLFAQGISAKDLFDFWQQPQRVERNSTSGRITWDMLEKAAPDECYFGLGDEANDYNGEGIDPGICISTESPANSGNFGKPKTNQGYAWSMVKTGTTVWIGTAANPHCLVIGRMTLPMGGTIPHETSAWVCEYEESNIFDPGRPVGDWRPPRIYAYDTETLSLVEKIPDVPLHLYRLRLTTGLRSAGTLDDVVFFAGPVLGQSAINIFAFNADGSYIGMTKMTAYENIRKWLVADGHLYTAVWDSDGPGSTVLKWTGSVDDPFQFEIVGHLNSQGRELAFHEGRIFISTRPKDISVSSEEFASLYMSPPVPEGGLSGDPAPVWTKVWEITDYEPDITTASATAGGALASFDGYLYWGTLMAPFASTISAFQRHFDENDPFTLDADDDGLEQEELFSAILGTYRAISVFRGKDFDTAPSIDLLYGQQYFPVYDPELKMYTIDLTPLHQNNMGEAPLWGVSGFGNFFNVYTWTMSASQDGLYIGTFDWSYLIGTFLYDLAVLINENNDSPEDQAVFDPQAFEDILELFDYRYGADLLLIPDSDTPGILESVDGLGNTANYGIRTMVPACEALYVGTANPMNLSPDGGWELIRIQSANNDVDEDGVPNGCDNCPGTANADQANADGDDTGDPCDTCTDTDGDGFGNPDFPANTCEADNCPDTANADQADADGDDIGDACDACTDTDGDGKGNPGFEASTCDTDNCPELYNPEQDYPFGDVNEDCLINTEDLDQLLGNLNQSTDVCPACDLNGDGSINTLDIMVLAKINPLILRDRRLRTLLSTPTRRRR